MSTDAPRFPPALTDLPAAALRSGRSLFSHPAAGPAGLAALAGGGAACALLPWTLQFGGDPAVTFAGRAAALAGFAAAWAVAKRKPVPLAVAGPLFAASLAVGPVLLTAADGVAATAPAGWLGGGRAAVWLTLAALVAVGPAAFAAGALFLGGARDGRGFLGGRLLAAGGGVAVGGLVLGPLVGLHVAGLLCGLGAVVAAGASYFKLLKAEAPPGLGFFEEPIRSHSGDAISPALAVACGVLCAGGLRAAATYFPLSAEVLVGRAAVAVAAIGAGLLLSRRLRRDRRAAVAGTVAVCGTAAAFAAGPVWVDLNLWANATVSAALVLGDVRILCAAAFLLPAALAVGLIGRRGEQLSGAACGGFGAGLAIGAPLLAALPDAAVVAGAVAVAAGLTVAAVVRVGSLRVPMRAAVGSAAVAAAVVAGTFSAPPTDAPRLLFSVLPALARQGGVTGPTLRQLDDARVLASVETNRDTVSLWRERGTRLVVRRDGLPEATAALQPALAPRDTAATLRAVLPLCWAEATGRVLLLGTPGPETAAAVVRFPVAEIVACDGRPAALAVVRQTLTDHRATDPFADDRMTVMPLDPALAVRSRGLTEGAKFDVIVLDPPHPAVAGTAAENTSSHALRTAALLSPTGVACRRVRTTDCGPSVLADAAATWRAAFAEVRAVEVGRGEFALLGTNAPGGLRDTRLGGRIDRPHVRAALAECGMDWSVPLNLTAVAPDRIDDLAAAGSVCSATDGRSAFALPREMRAWTDKPAAVAAVVVPLTTRLLDTAVPEVERPRVNHRLQEVVARQHLAAQFPDRPWAYRKALKERLTKQARSVIRQTSAGPAQVRHPEDQRRVEFVEALAAAADLTDANLAALEAFASPYDPILTPSLPGELARLYERRPDRSAARLRCLMAAVHHAPAGDRSVRDACDALAVLHADPAIIPDAAERYDAANGLLQVLKLRWEARGREHSANGVPGKTGVALHDVRRSLRAVDEGFALLSAGAAAAGVSDADRSAREAWLTRSLVNPLRAHRADLQTTHRRRLGLANAHARRPEGGGEEVSAPAGLPGVPGLPGVTR